MNIRVRSFSSAGVLAALVLAAAAVPSARAVSAASPAPATPAPGTKHPVADPWADAAPRGPRAYSPRFYATRKVDIAMRDGVKLHTRIITPRLRRGPLPVLMVRTPYGADRWDGGFGRDPAARWQRLAESGYVFVVQEMRGTEDSGGEFVLNPPRRADRKSRRSVDETTDTYDTIEWVLKNVPDVLPAVGVVGCSYPGYAAAMAGLSGHPALKAISPQAAMSDLFRGDDFFWNGIPILAQAPLFVPKMETRLEHEPRMDASDAYEWYLDAGALKDVQPRLFPQPSRIWNEMLANPTLGEFWQQRVLANHAAELVRVPTLHVVGWFDGEDFPGPMQLFRAMDEHDAKGTNRLIVGPWSHCMWNDPGPGDRIGPLNLNAPTAEQFKHWEARFFAHYLKGEGSLDDFPQVLAYRTGGDGWQRHARWPVADSDLSLYLADRQRLLAAPPAEPGVDAYVSDPLKPVPYARRPIDFFTGERIVPGDGRARALFLLEDQRYVQDRPDVLTWMSEPLAEDVVLEGNPVFEFHADTSGTDVDWIVQLVDVHPVTFDAVLSGYRLPVTRGALRASLREDLTRAVPTVPGKVEPYRIRLEARSHRFRAGHRVLVQLQSTYFPYLARNPQQFLPLATASNEDWRVVTNRVHRGSASPSRIVIPRASANADAAGTRGPAAR